MAEEQEEKKSARKRTAKKAAAPEAPQAAEPKPVEVTPEETPTQQGEVVNVGGKNYEVTPEGGHRIVRD